MGATSAEEAAEEGQEELRSMLEAWQSMLDHIASPHQDISAAPGELASLHAAAKRHMDVLSEHAATIDSAASSKKAPQAASPAMLRRRDELRAKVQERQVQLKAVIGKLRTLQDDICLLTCVVPPLEAPDKAGAIDRSQLKNGKSVQQQLMS